MIKPTWKKVMGGLILMNVLSAQAQGNCIVPGFPGCTRDDFDRALQIQQQQQFQQQQQQYFLQQQQQFQQQQLQELRRSNQIQQQMLEEQQFNNMLRPMRPVY